MVIWKGILKIADGKREAYIKEILEAGFIEEFTKQPGNVFYNIGASISDRSRCAEAYCADRSGDCECAWLYARIQYVRL